MATNSKKSLSAQIVSQALPASDAQTQGLSTQIEKSKTRNKSYRIDLNIHSPSALGYLALEGMDTAPALVRLAKVKGLDVIAVTDYYSGEYVDRVIAAARDTGLVVLPGVVIRCTVEGCSDVMLACLFPEDSGREQIEQFLTVLEVPAQARGDRAYAIRLPFERVLATVERFGGLAVPSRMDKTPCRKAAIRLLVEKYGFRAFDLAYYPESIQFFKANWPKIKFQLFNFSSATALAQIGNRHSKVKMPLPGFEGIKQLAGRAEVRE
jgi:hypothetical protein